VCRAYDSGMDGKSQAASELARLRWARVSAEDRSKIMSAVRLHPRKKARKKKQK